MRIASILAILCLALAAGCTQQLPGGGQGEDCDQGLSDCNGTCVNFESDNANCGACGTECQAGEVCTAGSCEPIMCGANEVLCGGACIDPTNNNTYCGATDCSTGNDADNGDSCDPNGGFSCTNGVCACMPGSTDCDSDSMCDNLQTSNAHCGACFNACDTPDEMCVNGECVREPGIAGALPAANGRWNYAGTLGVPGASGLCDMQYPGSQSCTRVQVEAGAAAGQLVGLTDIDGTTVNSLWIDDVVNGTEATRCYYPPENGFWHYMTQDFGNFGNYATLDNATGTLGAIATDGCNTGMHHVVCCYP